MNGLHAQPPAVNAEPQPLGRVLASAEAAGLVAVPGALAGVEVTGVVADSRAVTPGALFAALASDGDGPDGHVYVDAALAAGARVALVSEAWAAENVREAALPAADTRAAVAEAAAGFYGRPADRLAVVGVTGTNGKTTTAFLLHHLFTSLGHPAGLVGTVENRVGEDRYATAYTTPEAPELQRLLRAMVEAGVTHVAMEVSSHGLALARVRTVPFRVAVFTNLTHDHLDFHKTAEAYAASKKSLFDGLAPDATAVVNADDPAWRAMTADTAARVVTYGTAEDADVRVQVVGNALGGLSLRIGGHAARPFRLAGRFNALNLAAAYASGVALGFDEHDVFDALASAPGVPGRFEAVPDVSGVLGVVDYAHTPDALDNVLATAQEIVPEGRSLWVVFGCGGDRDRSKRAEMGDVATRHTPHVVLTSDNPRSEDPEAILDDIEQGTVRPAVRIADRRAAIAYAVGHAAPGDVVVVAGKGHETYQIVGATRRHFDDREALRAAFDARPGASAPAAASSERETP